jgi:hypothetical protein
VLFKIVEVVSCLGTVVEVVGVGEDITPIPGLVLALPVPSSHLFRITLPVVVGAKVVVVEYPVDGPVEIGIVVVGLLTVFIVGLETVLE